MTYRYLFHLLGSVTDMYTARKARTAGPIADTGARPGVRRRVGRRAVRQGARAVGGGAPGDGVAGLHGQRAHACSTLGSASATCVGRGRAARCRRRCVGVDRVLVNAVLRAVDDVSATRTSSASPRSTTCRSPCAGARRSRCSAPTAAASRRCSRSSTACSFPDAGDLPRVRRRRSPRTRSRTSSSTAGFRSRVGFVFQNSDAQVFSPTVREEIAFGPLNLGLARDEVAAPGRRHARDARHRRISPTARRTSCRAGRRSGSRSRRCS